MASLFLTPQDLSELTGYRLGAWQRLWLRNAGWSFVEDCNGRPKVLREYAETRLGITSKHTGEAMASAPNFDRIR